MSKLARLYEMPRPKGTWSPAKRAALTRAKETGQPFTVKQFGAWMKELGGATDNPMSVGGYLKKIAADGQDGRPTRPDSLHPLKIHRPFRRGIGGDGTYVYALDPSKPIGTDPAPKKAPSPKGVQQEPGEFDDDEAELAAMGFTKVDEPGAEKEPEDPGEFSQSDDEDWGDSGEIELDDPDDDMSLAPDEPEGSNHDWIPQPDGMGSYAESSMEKLADKGFGPENDFWVRISQTSGDVAAHALIRKELPITLQRPALAVAKQIFQNLDKDWEGGGKESIVRLYRVR